MDIIEADGWLVRTFEDTDAESLAKHANHPDIARNVRDEFPHPYTVRDARDFIASMKLTPLSYAVVIDREAAGSIGLIPGRDVHRYSWELGYWLGERHWGKGIMSRVVDAFAAWAMEEFSLNRLFAQVFSTNPASMRVLEKAGFVKEGVQRSHVFKHGRILDCALFGRIRRHADTQLP